MNEMDKARVLVALELFEELGDFSWLIHPLDATTGRKIDERRKIAAQMDLARRILREATKEIEQ